ncbi:glycoside hydrolase family 13 protein [Corallincola holothuriorum]|uniref:glycoside hydrolase family 13 protein n=1 Tax=Corallincola holothuriorum TaxID=2282215 RepID=UPI001314D708|nr:glycoside hydrolase family 13 protein [Corallincola holothuriorum]
MSEQAIGPDWVKEAVFYQIFPDRFARGKEISHSPGLVFKPWGADPAEQGFQGGDLYGVIDNLDYLKSLGVTAIYLCPIFASACNHRYHTFDYMQVDPLLGGNDALRKLLDEAHARDMKVVLDGVFNHASRGFWAFHHILENGGDSPYIDWFKVQDWPLRPYSSDEDNPPNYDAWWNLPALPKFNHQNPGWRAHIFDVAEYWLKFGIDGWRLDVPREIEDDDFWREFRARCKAVNPDAYICGEIWMKAQRWLQGDMFDATMNYIQACATLSYIGADSWNGYRRNNLEVSPMGADSFVEVMEDMYASYAWGINEMQLNLLGSHDMARPLWIMGEDKKAMKLALLTMFATPGAPCIYYGDEIGMSAGDDPYCREGYPWDEPEKQDRALFQFIAQLAEVRKGSATLCHGEIQFLSPQQNCVLFTRKYQGDTLLVALNPNQQAVSLTLPKDGELLFQLGDKISIATTTLCLSAQSAAIVKL